MTPALPTFAFAKAASYDDALTVLFGTNTTAAGHAATTGGDAAQQRQAADRPWSAPAIRLREEQSRSLSEDLSDGDDLFDLGDIELSGDANQQILAVKAAFRCILASNKIPVCLGGDHLVKYGCIDAVAEVAKRPFGVIYLDAHPDCQRAPELQYDTILHHAFSNGLLDPTLCRLVGLRECTLTEAEGLRHYGCPVIRGGEFASEGAGALADRVLADFASVEAIYVSIDPDAFNPSDVGAVKQSCASGPLIDQVLAVLRRVIARKTLLGFDISEHVPRLDSDGRTSSAMGRLIKKLVVAARSTPRMAS